MLSVEGRNKLKSEIQDKVLNYSAVHNHLLITFATGIGKTRASLLVLNDYRGDWLICVKEVSHIKNWKEEFIKHGFEDLLEKVTFTCYASMHKYERSFFEGIILDEVHACCSNKRLRSLSQISAVKVLGLSATIDDDKKEALMNIHPFKVCNYPLKKAIKNGVLPVPTVKIFSLEMKPSQKVEYERICKNIDYLKGAFMQSLEEWRKHKWLQACSKRKKWIADFKQRAIKEVIDEQTERFICFCSDIAQAENLADHEAEYTVHSKNILALENIDNFNAKIIDKLFTVKMLQEGNNLTDCEIGFIAQLDNQTLSVTQKIGRLLRCSEPVVYVFHLGGTQDDKYLENVLEVIPEIYIEYINN